MLMREKIRNKAVDCENKHRSQVECSGTHDWCAQFCSRVLNWCGINIYNTFVGPLRDDMLKSGLFFEPENHPIFGDYLFIDWDHKIEARPLDHVAICVDYDENTGTVTYINGNGSSSLYVLKEHINVNSPNLMYWLRYKEETDLKPVKKEEKIVNIDVRQLSLGDLGKDVESMQAILISKGYSCGTWGSDGEFGKATEKAVMNFQTDHKLTSDGICGPKTWQELINK